MPGSLVGFLILHNSQIISTSPSTWTQSKRSLGYATLGRWLTTPMTQVMMSTAGSVLPTKLLAGFPAGSSINGAWRWRPSWTFTALSCFRLFSMGLNAGLCIARTFDPQRSSTNRSCVQSSESYGKIAWATTPYWPSWFVQYRSSCGYKPTPFPWPSIPKRWLKPP